MGGVNSHKNNSDDEDDNNGITFMLPIPEWDLLNLKENSEVKSSTPRENLRRKSNVVLPSERNISTEVNEDDLMTRYHKDCQKYIGSTTDGKYRNCKNKIDDDDEYWFDDDGFTEDEYETDKDDTQRCRKNAERISNALSNLNPLRIRNDYDHDSDPSLETQKSTSLPLRTSTFYKGKGHISPGVSSIKNFKCGSNCQRIVITRLVESETSDNEDVHACLCFVEMQKDVLGIGQRSFDSGLNSAQESVDSDNGAQTCNRRVLHCTCKFKIDDLYKEMYTTNKIINILNSSNESIESLDGSSSGQSFCQPQSTSIRESGHTSFESGRGSLLSSRIGLESSMSSCYSSDDISTQSGTRLKNLKLAGRYAVGSSGRSQLTGRSQNVQEMESEHKQNKMISNLTWKSYTTNKNTKFRDSRFNKNGYYNQRPESDSDTGHHCSITNSSSSTEELHRSISDSGINDDITMCTWSMERKEDYCTITRRLDRLLMKDRQQSSTNSITSASSCDKSSPEPHSPDSLRFQLCHDLNSVENTDDYTCRKKADKGNCSQHSNRVIFKNYGNRHHPVTSETSTDSESNTECNMEMGRRREVFKSSERQIYNLNKRRGSYDKLRRGSLNDVQRVQSSRRRRGSLKSSEEQNLPNIWNRRGSLNIQVMSKALSSKLTRTSCTNDQQNFPRLAARRGSLNLQDATRCPSSTRRRRSLNSSDIQTLTNMSPGYLADNDDSNDAGFHSNDQENSSDLSTSPPVRIHRGWDSFRVNRVRIKSNRCRCRCRKRSDQRQKQKEVNHSQDSSDGGR